MDVRCEYMHPFFSGQNKFNHFREDLTHDGTRQCWLEGNDVAEFVSSEGKEVKRYCLFHAHHATECWTQAKWDTASLGEKQSTRLKELLNRWNTENKNRKSNDKTLFTFALPGMRCGNVSFVDYSFSDCLFFNEATFSGGVWFLGTTFNKSALFKNAMFNGEVLFDGVTFSGSADFDNAKFSGTFSFYHVRCIKTVTFKMNTCGEAVSFRDSKFDGKLDFHLPKMEKGGRFVNCLFDTFTYQTHIGERLLFNHCKTKTELSFVDQDCSRLAFLNMDLTKADFLGADVSKTRYDACQWKEKGGPKYAAVYKHDDYLKPAKQTTDEEEKKKNDEDYKNRVSKLKALYRQLMKNLEENREYKQAGDFHYREMELRQKMLKDGLADPESWFERPMLWLYRAVGDFGESYVKLGFWLIVSWLSTACLIWSYNLDKTYKHILGIVITAIIPGWPKPQTIADFNPFCKTVLVVEVVIAVILTTLFAMAVNRRYRR